MEVLISGASGLIGSALRRTLSERGDRVVALKRGRATGPGEIAWDPAEGAIDAAALEGFDAVVHLAGEGIGEKKWNDEHKRRIRESRTRGTATLVDALLSRDQKP